MKTEEYKISENAKEWKNISVDDDFDNNIFDFVMEEKFKLLNYTYEYIDRMYEDIANFPRKHELIKNKLVETSFELLEKLALEIIVTIKNIKNKWQMKLLAK